MGMKQSMLSKMIVLAATRHDGQFDRGGKPYFLHTLTVMQFTESSDEEILCIGIGHDLIEDTKTTYQELRELGISERVIDGIRAMTKVPGKTPDEYLARIMANADAVIVKMADLRHNSDITRLKGVTEKDIKRMAKYHQMYETLKAHRATLGV